jgi:hypothetical protein
MRRSGVITGRRPARVCGSEAIGSEDKPKGQGNLSVT